MLEIVVMLVSFASAYRSMSTADFEGGFSEQNMDVLPRNLGIYQGSLWRSTVLSFILCFLLRAVALDWGLDPVCPSCPACE